VLVGRIGELEEVGELNSWNGSVGELDLGVAL